MVKNKYVFMFKVICVNNGMMKSPFSENYYDAPELSEGEIYTVININKEFAYVLKEVKFDKNIFLGFNHNRFIPLSEIDETELTNYSIKENIYAD